MNFIDSVRLWGEVLLYITVSAFNHFKTKKDVVVATTLDYFSVVVFFVRFSVSFYYCFLSFIFAYQFDFELEKFNFPIMRSPIRESEFDRFNHLRIPPSSSTFLFLKFFFPRTKNRENNFFFVKIIWTLLTYQFFSPSNYFRSYPLRCTLQSVS